MDSCEHPQNMRKLIEYSYPDPPRVPTGQREICAACGSDLGPALADGQLRKVAR